ncbi:MAG: DUF2764 family protein [Prochlorococcaceae cyanobacterium]
MSPRYTTLVASLPPLGGLFEAREPAISRLKLQSRLSLLHPNDRSSLDRAIGILSQGLFETSSDDGGSSGGGAAQGPVGGDALLLADTQRFFLEVSNPLLRQLVGHRLDLRTVVAALRRRHRGESEPPRDQAWGYGPLLPTIERHWSEPTLGLAGVLPWIGEALRLLESNDLIGLERLLFTLIWRELDRLAQGHNFDFEAVVIYLARWSLVERWSNYDSVAAARRFRQLVHGGLGRFTDTIAVCAAR